ncbi:hypothetical protein MMPV_001345 [Pyropia vietnamensis]
MAVLMSARHTSGTQRVPPTPVHFGGIGSGSLFPSGDPAVTHTRRNRRNEGLESDSSEELERSHAERHTRSTSSGQREQQPGGFSRYMASTGGDGGGPSLPSQEGSVPSLPEVGPGTIPATLLQALTTQITVRIMEKMESDEFAHQLAKRLGNQDTGKDIVNEVFRSVLTPERYRLDDRSPVVTDAMRNTSHRAIRSMQTLMKGVPMFGNPNGRPLAVIGFFSSFKAAADKALVNEGLAVEILPFFVDERVRGILRQAAPIPGMRSSASPTSYEGILKELLSSYLSEDKCEDHYRALRTATAHPWEDEEMFGRRIQELDYELGKLLGEGELRAILFAGVPNYVRISARGANTAKTTFSRLMHLCKSLGDAYRVLHPECALQAKPKGNDDKTVDTGPVSEPRRSRPEPKAPPVLVASGYPEAEHDWDSTRALVDYQGHKLVPAMPVVDDQGTESDEEPLARQGPEIVRETFPTREVPAKIVVNNPMFRDVFDCESYSLVNKSLTYGSREAHTLGRRKKDVAQSFGVRSEWDGTPPLKVFQFLRKFAKACDDNDVSEAEAFFMLQDFTKEPLRSEVMSVMPSRHGGNPGEVNSYLELINWMLRYHADEASLAAQVEEFNRATQTPGY